MKKNYNTPNTEELNLGSDVIMDLTVNVSPFGGEFDAPARGAASELKYND